MERAVNTAAPLPFQYNNANLPRDNNSGSFNYNRRLKEFQLVNLKSMKPDIGAANVKSFNLDGAIWGPVILAFKNAGRADEGAESRITNWVYDHKLSEDVQREQAKEITSSVKKRQMKREEKQKEREKAAAEAAKKSNKSLQSIKRPSPSKKPPTPEAKPTPEAQNTASRKLRSRTKTQG